MSIFLAFAISFLLLLFSAMRGYFIGYPLLISMAIFVAIFWRQGFSLQSLWQMGVQGSRKAFPVFSVLLMIGAVTSSWMAAGTVPAIVYYGIQIISPKVFILAAFVLTALVSLLIGTSFGSVSTIGIALMIMARGSGVDPHLIAGAIIAGAYVGDRCSPMSSSALLIATITQTRLYTNIYSMWVTSVLPLVLSLLVYAGLAALNPVQIAGQSFVAEIPIVFHLHPMVLLPAVVILVLSLLQVPVRRSMLISIGVAGAIALSYQHRPFWLLLRDITLGFRLDSSTSLQSIFVDGGILSMMRVCGVVILSTAFVGIFAGTRILERLDYFLQSAKTRSDCFLSTCLVGTGAAAFGCTQTIAILLTQQLVEHKYKENEKGNYKLALDLENTVVVIAPLIPWNIAGLVPATVLSTDLGFVPFAVYLYLIPLLNLLHLRLSVPPKLKLCN